MTLAEIENLRVTLLQLLRESGSYAQTVPLLVTGAKRTGFGHACDEIVRCELTYLADKGLVAIDPKLLSPENKRWRLTAEGRDHLAMEGL
jgi:hypothetical protein